MTVWQTAIRISPIAATAIYLTRAREPGDRRAPSVYFGAKSSLCSQEVSSRNKFRIRDIVVKSRAQTKKGLLGQSQWIYRLVCSVDIFKVYDLERELGQGGFGTVYLGRHKHMGYHRAVKKIPKSEDKEENEEVIQEIYTLMDLDHPHIIKLSRTYDDGNNLYIVSEFCKGPSLFDRIVAGPMSEHDVGVALRHMLKAVLCCHAHYRGHYDIKPDNFMYSDPDCKKLKMIDLGLSSGFKRDPNQFKGTVIYVAPEVFFGMYGPEADVWSCGVVLFVMATRQSLCPMDASDEKVSSLLQDRRWVKDRLNWASEIISPDCLDLLRKMLCYDRHMRITAADALKHPFVDNTYYKPKKRKDNREEEAAMSVIRSMSDSFVDFGREPVIVRAALLVMVHIAGYTTKETRAHRLAYAMLDRVGSGELSIDSIEAMMPKYGLPIPHNLDEGFQAVDLNHNGYITYGNFLSATLPLSVRCREDLCHRAFSLLDQNHDGVIDLNDLAATFLSQEEMDNEMLRKLCSQAIEEVGGSDEKSCIDFDKFLGVVLRGNSLIIGNEFTDD